MADYVISRWGVYWKDARGRFSSATMTDGSVAVLALERMAAAASAGSPLDEELLATFMKQVRKETLRRGKPVVWGVFVASGVSWRRSNWWSFCDVRHAQEAAEVVAALMCCGGTTIAEVREALAEVLGVSRGEMGIWSVRAKGRVRVRVRVAGGLVRQIQVGSVAEGREVVRALQVLRRELGSDVFDERLSRRGGLKDVVAGLKADEGGGHGRTS